MATRTRIHRLAALPLALALAMGAVVPNHVAAPSSAAAAEPPSAILFAADGMRQDLISGYVADGLLPTFADLLKKGASADWRRDADPGTPEHRCRLVQHGDRRLARRPRLDEQHLPHQRQHVRQLDGIIHAWHPPGPDARPVRGSGWPEGGPDRVGRRAHRRHQWTDRRLSQLRLRTRRRHQLHQSRRQRSIHLVVQAPIRLEPRPPRPEQYRQRQPLGTGRGLCRHDPRRR